MNAFVNLLTRIFALVVVWAYCFSSDAHAQSQPSEAIELRYRIELMDKDKWKPVKDNKKFKKNHTIRFRFTSNVAGALYVLNSGEATVSPQPIFTDGRVGNLRRSLGAGAFIAANRVGIFPDADWGGGLRFVGLKGKERFLLVFVPNALDEQRAVLPIAPGAEDWHFDAKTSYAATGTPGHMLFHYLELKSK